MEYNVENDRSPSLEEKTIKKQSIIVRSERLKSEDVQKDLGEHSEAVTMGN